MKITFLRKNNKGQIAIFIALVFQVLFVFFAMVINIGLLVHQKINLQNSVDLAAYYAAMKQAENLNAIAHVNYQIRQSWKLLLFRYHQLGMGGEEITSPYNSVNKTIRYEDDNLENQSATVFCTAYSPFDVFAGQDYCKKIPQSMLSPLNIPKPTPSTNIFTNAVLSGFGQVIANATALLGSVAVQGCKKISSTNWYILARYIAAYKKDLVGRKRMIYLLSNGMSKDANDFLDIEGESVKEGVEKTLKKNLSPENRDNFSTTDFELFNSFAAGDCGFQADEAPPKWLVETSILPILYYMDANCNNSSQTIDFKVESINTRTVKGPNHPENYSSVVDYLDSYIKEPDGNVPASKLYKSTLGFEKNPWCMGYVSVKAKSSPNIPFSPFGKVTLKAEAYAKPFGGRIGPWYGSMWPSSAPQSDHAKRMDEMVPTRVKPGEVFDPNDVNFAKNFQPSYSRYVGDATGVRSQLTYSQFGKAIHNIGTFTFNWWNHHLEEDFDSPSSNADPLAWDAVTKAAPPIRNVELAAVAPDHFDLNYYSIEPDFYRNYLAKIEKRKDLGKVIPRGDLGSRRLSDDKKLKSFSVKDQIALLTDEQKVIIDTNNKLTYYVRSFAHLLNSWQGKNAEDYSVDPDRFGKCSTDTKSGVIPDDADNEAATPGNCRAGGRVGYSVKLVDPEYLKRSDLELGGLGQKGSIKNPPP